MGALSTIMLRLSLVALMLFYGVSKAAELAGLPLAEAIDRLAEEGGLAVIYNDELVAPGLLVAEDSPGARTEDRLRGLLEPFGLTLEAGPGGRWLVVRLPRVSARTVRLSGTVRDAASDQPVAGARIAVYPGADIATSDADGAFVLDVAATRLTVIGSAADYHELHLDLPAGEHARPVELRLRPRLTSLAPITVTASHYTLLYSEASRSQFLSREEVDRLPHIADDVFRALHWLPGVARGDFSAQPHVRGGAPNEMSVVLDGLTLHQPYHLKDLLGIFSVIDSNAIDGVEFYSGVFPARFGDANSAVLAVDSLSHGAHNGRLGISFINAFAQGSGGLGENAWWMASGRTGYLDIVLDYIDEESGLDPSYADFLGKVGFDPGRDTQVELSTLLAVDHSLLREDADSQLTLDLVDGDFTDAYLWLTADRTWTDSLSSRTLLFGGTLRRDRIGIVGEPLVSVGRLADDRTFDFYGFEQGIDYQADAWRLSAGLELQRQSVDYRYRAESAAGPGAITGSGRFISIDPAPSGTVLGVYASVQYEPAPKWRTELGARLDRQTYLDPADNQFSPRMSLLYSPAERTHLRLGWGRFHQAQGIEELQVEDGLDRFFPAQQVDQSVASIEHSWPNGVDLRAEAYYKSYANPMPYFDQLFDDHDVLPELRSDRVRIDPEKARARGIEIDIRKFDRPDFRWWATYAYARAEERIDGRWIPRDWDQPHAFNAGVSVAAAKWIVTFAFRYHTGWPTTPVETLEVGVDRVPVLGERNSARHSVYHRLDMRASRQFDLPNSVLHFYVELINLYDRKNICCRDVFAFDFTGQGQEVFDFSSEWLPFLPSLGIKWEW